VLAGDVGTGVRLLTSALNRLGTATRASTVREGFELALRRS